MHPFSKVNPTCLKAGELTLKHTSSRILQCSDKASFLNVGLLVCHAPHNGTDAEARMTWWSSLKAILNECKLARVDTLMLIHANFRFGEAHGHHCGGHQLEQVDENTASFLEALELGRMCATFTFEEDSAGHYQATWLSNCGKWHRLDYICSPVRWRDGHIAVEVTTQIDVATVKFDHIAVLANFRHSSEVGKRGPATRRSLLYSKLALKDPECCEIFSRAWEKIQVE